MVYVARESTGLWGTFTTDDGTVVSGTTYTFWITAHNYVGEGENSEKLAILASQVPDAPEAPTAIVTFNSIHLEWTMPNDHGTPITYYTLFMDSDGNNSDDYH